MLTSFTPGREPAKQRLVCCCSAWTQASCIPSDLTPTTNQNVCDAADVSSEQSSPKQHKQHEQNSISIIFDHGGGSSSNPNARSGGFFQSVIFSQGLPLADLSPKFAENSVRIMRRNAFFTASSHSRLKANSASGIKLFFTPSICGLHERCLVGAALRNISKRHF